MRRWWILAALLCAMPAQAQIIGNYTANRIVGGTKPARCNAGPPADVWVDTSTNPPVFNFCGPSGWIALGSGGGGTPGGMDTQIQFNNMGAFGGDAGLTFDPTRQNGIFNLSVSDTGVGETAAVIIKYIPDTIDLNAGGVAAFDVELEGAGPMYTGSLNNSEVIYAFNGAAVVKGNAVGIWIDGSPNSALNQVGLRVTQVNAGTSQNLGIEIGDVTGAPVNRAIQTGAGDILFGTLASMDDSLPVCRHADGTLYSGTNVAGVAHCS